MSCLSIDEFVNAAKDFVQKSDKIHDGWFLKENTHCVNKTYIKKYAFIPHECNGNNIILKVEYIIFFHMSYQVPTFSFNIWNSSGSLISLEEIRLMSFLQINQKEFYSVITQQEHPLFQRPYFMVHPCHTDELLTMFQNKSKNIIVTFLGLITPLINLNLSMDYGL